MSNRLRRLVNEISGRGATRRDILASHPSALTNRIHTVTDDGMVQCYVDYHADATATVTAIAGVGGTVELVSEPMGLVQARLPYDQMDALAGNPAIRSIRLPAYRVVRTGSVTSQGDVVHRCNLVRTSWGWTGLGMKVGVISDGINGIGTSQALGDIPPAYQAQSARADGNLYAGAEGLAMMEIVYDLAPGASLAFSNPNTSAEMIDAINVLDSTFHCNVICDDLGFADEPFFEDGPIVSRIDQAVAHGAIYCSAAGNEANQNYYEGDYAGISRSIGGATLNVQNFNGAGDWNMRAYVPGAGGMLVVVLQWNDPWGASGNDYDLYLTNSTGSVVYASSTNNQNGAGYPVEALQYTNNGAGGGYVYVVVSQASGAARHLKMVGWGNGWFTEYYAAAGSTWGHPAAMNVIGCGAVPAASPNTIEPYSSRGPVRIDFPSLVYRNKPDLCGADGVSVTANGGFVTPFYGTSAAAPHVAAVCAQIWSFNPAMSNSTLRNLVQTTAVDLGAPGYDTIYGYGRADAVNAASALAHCPGTITVTASPPAGGTVSGAGSYSCGANATVTASPNPSYSFVNWTENGTQVSTSPNYAFTVAGDRTLVANFSTSAINYTVTTAASPVAGGTTSGNGTYAAGASVTVNAAANLGYGFVNWTENGVQVSASANYPFTITGNRTLVANFSLVPPAATPTISPSGGTFSDSVQVTLACTTPGATITYTTNGSDPTASSTPYFVPFALTSSATVKARAFAGGYGDSAVAAAAFTVNAVYVVATSASPTAGGTTSGDGSYPIGTKVTVRATANSGYTFVNWSENGTIVSTSANFQFTVSNNRTLVAHFSLAPPAATPTISPNGGTFAGPVQVTLACTTPGATITYTTDGSDPTTNSTPYTASFTLTSSATVKARAFAGGYSDSAVAAAGFTVNGVYVVATSASPAAGGTTSGDGSYPSGTPVTVRATANSGYTFANWSENGTTVSTSASLQFTVSNNRTLVASFSLAPPAATPTISPNGGTFSAPVQVALACTTPGATITYTTDDTDPTANSTSYVVPFALATSATVKAKAFASHLNDSVVAVAAFVITPTYTLTIQAAGTPNVVQTHPAGTSVMVSAPPAPDGERFSAWSGDVTGTDNPITIILNRNETITANYEACPLQHTAPCGQGVPVCGVATMVLLGIAKGNTRRKVRPVDGRRGKPSSTDSGQGGSGIGKRKTTNGRR